MKYLQLNEKSLRLARDPQPNFSKQLKECHNGFSLSEEETDSRRAEDRW